MNTTTQTTPNARQIAARFASTCPGCGERIQIGQFVMWAQGCKATCLHCSRKPAAAKPVSRCPNPRDCGDPTCNGSCGY